MHNIKYEITCKDCNINLVKQKIKIEKMVTKFAKWIEKFLKQNLPYMYKTKNKKENLQLKFSGGKSW